MDRRTFVKNAFGLVVLTAFSGAGVLGASGCSARPRDPYFMTPAIGEPEDAVGPLLMAGIGLVELPESGRVAAYYDDTELFNVDAAGAQLITLADGRRTIDEIAVEAAALGCQCAPVDVALFFSSLGQAGYLRNRVLVSILDKQA